MAPAAGTEERVEHPGGSDRYRTRLIAGLAAALSEKELGATTVADIVSHAHVSKRTFYEHFADKRECFAALAMSVTDQMLGVIDQAIEREDTWEGKARAATRTYMEVAASSPKLTRSLVLEIQAGGPEALRVRRRAYELHANTFVRLSEQAAAERPDVRPMSAATATAIVAGINELMLEAVEDGRTDRLTEVVDTAFGLIHAVAFAPPADS
ncbi:MAG TPA: TetR/AcrR family transcriptional regulator [Thermoleophilaceae bacterium]|nr:TetR/AcrR family transcriptional regulator [Thermoleophilaceae bacterium]